MAKLEESLKITARSDAPALFSDFMSDTGAEVMVTDEAGSVVPDIIEASVAVGAASDSIGMAADSPATISRGIATQRADLRR